MTWSAPMTAVSGSVFTAAQFNTFVRDNLLACPASLATTNGSFFASTGANSLAERIPASARLDVSELYTGTSFGDAPTPGPTLTLTTGQHALIIVSAELNNQTGSAGAQVGVDISGATTEAASANYCLRQESSLTGEFNHASMARFHNSLTPGTNTFRLKYAVTAGSMAINFREICVIPF